MFGHESRAAAAADNPWSTRMLASLQSLARRRFDSEYVAADYADGRLEQALEWFRDTIPADVLAKRTSTAA